MRGSGGGIRTRDLRGMNPARTAAPLPHVRTQQALPGVGRAVVVGCGSVYLQAQYTRIAECIIPFQTQLSTTSSHPCAPLRELLQYAGVLHDGIAQVVDLPVAQTGSRNRDARAMPSAVLASR
jgi:hypothetical protein